MNTLIGGTTGTILGAGAWAIIGTVGVVTGGTGIALGFLGFTTIGTVVGAVSGLATDLIE